MEPEVIEKIIIKSAFIDKKFTALISSVFEKDYFDNDTAANIFELISTHFQQYGNIIPRDTITVEDANEFFQEIDAIDFDVSKNYKYLLNVTNEYLKEKAVKKAILESVTVINSKKETVKIKSLIEEALCKDLNVDLGLDYFNTLGDRLRKILSAETIRIPTYFPQFDEFINGGFPPYTLSIITAAIHSHKSSTIANFSARQVLHGENVAILTLEMSEDAYAQRYDAIFSKLDINKLYLKSYISKLSNSLKQIKNDEKIGSLFIKQFPTGQGTIIDFTRYLRELRMRDIVISIIYCDYINLMKPSYKTKSDMYSDVKNIAEELRALSFEFKAPVVSVTQLNREGSQLSFSDVDFTYTSECLDPSTLVKHVSGDIRIDELKIGDMIQGSSGLVEVKRVFDKKMKHKFLIKTKNGKKIIGSRDHVYPTSQGLKSIESGLKVGDKIQSFINI